MFLWAGIELPRPLLASLSKKCLLKHAAQCASLPFIPQVSGNTHDQMCIAAPESLTILWLLCFSRLANTGKESALPTNWSRAFVQEAFVKFWQDINNTFLFRSTAWWKRRWRLPNKSDKSKWWGIKIIQTHCIKTTSYDKQGGSVRWKAVTGVLKQDYSSLWWWMWGWRSDSE